ncbi:MAG: hypothetical protein Q9191_002912 [Dirinaria sp. TL-2023a]
MTRSVAIKSLTEDLVRALAGGLTEELKPERLTLATLRTLSTSRAVSTDALEVESRLAGLEEKFRIHNNDGLADALRIRLNELTNYPNKYNPEILCLLLHLSDRPSQNAHVEDPNLPGPELLPPPLTWSEVFEKDPLDNAQGIWDSVDYAGGSDEEECFKPNEQPFPDESTDPSIDSGEDSGDSTINFEDLILPVEKIPSRNRLETRSLDDGCQIGRPSSHVATEMQLCRGVLFMLQGLPTSTFAQLEDGRYLFSMNCHLSHLSTESLTHLLNSFAVTGSMLANVRKWVTQPTKIPILQTVQSAVSARLADFTRYLFALEAFTSGNGAAGVISLLDLLTCIRDKSRIIQKLAKITESLDDRNENESSFKALEFFYASTCAAQANGDLECYRDMAQIFFGGFETYLKPIRAWMENGDLVKSDNVFFVKQNECKVPCEALWNEQYSMARLENGQAYAPNFVHTAAKKIFNAGKSVRFLKTLNEAMNGHHMTWESDRLDIKIINGEQGDGTLTPFSELFDYAFNKWTTKRYYSSSTILRQQLETHCGLHDTLNVLEHIYLQRDGARSSNALYSLFDMIDGGKGASADSVIVTQLFREAFDPVLGPACQRLSVRYLDGLDLLQRKRSIRASESLQLSYAIPWAVANIIPPGALVHYQRVFVLLVQSRRVIHRLDNQHFGRISLATRQNPAAEVRLALLLRHRLLWFANAILAYLTGPVIAATTIRMREDIAKANDLDDMISVHKNYVLQLERQCLLSRQLTPIHTGIISVFDLAMSFAEAHGTAMRLPQSSDITITHPRKSRQYNRDAASSSLSGGNRKDVETGQEGQCPDISYETTNVYRVSKMHKTFKKLHSFILAGLRGVHRTGAEPSWEILANLLAVDFGAKLGDT